MSQKHIDALKIARKEISQGFYVYVCNALPSNNAGDEIRAWIRKAIKPCTDIEWWLRRFHRIHPTCYEAEQYRLLWIDHLIEEVRDWK